MLRRTTLAFIGIFGQLIQASQAAAGADLIPRQHVSGAISFDDVDSTCSFDQANIVKRAFRDVIWLMDAVEGVTTNDPSFIEFFGVGWTGVNAQYFSYIPGNIAKAKQLVLDRTSGTKVSVTCADTNNECERDQLAAHTSPIRNGIQTIVVCPLTFDLKLHRFHITDRVGQRPIDSLRALKSYEHIFLHELMHVDNVGYQTTREGGHSQFPSR
jgi:hypothetical protein